MINCSRIKEGFRSSFRRRQKHEGFRLSRRRLRHSRRPAVALVVLAERPDALGAVQSLEPSGVATLPELVLARHPWRARAGAAGLSGPAGPPGRSGWTRGTARPPSPYAPVAKNRGHPWPRKLATLGGVATLPAFYRSAPSVARLGARSRALRKGICHVAPRTAARAAPARIRARRAPAPRQRAGSGVPRPALARPRRRARPYSRPNASQRAARRLAANRSEHGLGRARLGSP